VTSWAVARGTVGRPSDEASDDLVAVGPRCSELPDWLKGATPEALGRHLLAHDGVAALLPAETLEQLVVAALEDGAAAGLMLRTGHPDLPPDLIAGALGVSVVEIDEEPWAGPFLRFADYGSHPPKIRLFRTAIGFLDRLLWRSGLSDRVSIDRTAPIFIAHELYHHIEATREAPPLARRHAATRLRFCHWQLRAPVLAMPEIAAGACAQALVGLGYHPAILDVIVRWYLGPRALSAGLDFGRMGECLKIPRRRLSRINREGNESDSSDDQAQRLWVHRACGRTLGKRPPGAPRLRPASSK
jgi:hypothetical protein